MDGFKECSKRIVKREVSTKKNHLLSLFKNFEVTILDKKKKYHDKLQSLISAWEQIGTFVAETSSESPQPEFDSLFLHTLRLVLRADWKNVSKATKTHLSTTLSRIIADLTNGKRFFSILPQCRVLESVINDPWDHPVLKKIFQDEIVDIDELIDYFHFENGKVIVIRLEILLESKCEEFASHLSKACLMTFNLTDPLELELNQDEVDYITDIYLCCLFRAKNTKDIIAELKIFDINDGLHLLQRYNKQGGVGCKYNENCKEARVWKCSKKVIELISSTLLANAVIQENFASSDIDILHELIREWASVHTSCPSDIFSPVPLEMIWKCVLIARCSMCIYPFCSFLIECGGKQHDLNHLLRCLIRAININMNEIETHRVCRNNEKLKFTHDMLAEGFLLTAEVFREYRNIFRECLLTAFSLTPTRESLQRLEDFVNNVAADVDNIPKMPATDTEIKIKAEIESVPDESEDQNLVNDDNEAATTSSDAPIISKDVRNEPKPINNELNTILETIGVDSENADLNEIKSELNTSSNSMNETMKGTSSAYISEVESMNIEESIKTDLNSILRYQRHHTLTWDLEWPVLKVNCEKYHEMFEKRGFDEVELKYLELDYNQFKNHPMEIDESAGIEKGYEHFITNEIDEESDGEYGYSGKVGYSSDDSYYGDRYERKKRKKSRSRYDEDYDWTRSMTQKKRPKPKIKIESFITPDEYTADSLLNGDAAVRILTYKKKLHGRARDGKSSDSETNADSQSENQPPEDEEKGNMLIDDVIDDCGVRTTANNLKLLRQFRISLSKPLISEENTTNIARQLSSGDDINRVTTEISSSLGKSADRTFVDGESVRLVICIPKCDAHPYFNDVQMLDAFRDKHLLKPEKLSSVEVLSSSKKSISNVDTSAVVNCPDPRNDDKNNSSDRGRGSMSRRQFKYHAKQSLSSKRFYMNRMFRKKLFGVSVFHSNHPKHAKEHAEGIDDLISEIFPEFSSNGSWQTNGNIDDNFFEPPPPPPPPVAPSQLPTQTLSEFLDTTLDSTLGPTSSNEATFVSSTVELASLALPINPVADGASPPSCNELTPLQPASSPPMARVLSSYLNSSIDTIDNLYSYPSNMCHNGSNVQPSLTNDDLSAYELSATEFIDISTSVAEAAYPSYPNFQPQIPDDVYSMNVSSTYDAVAVPSSSGMSASLPPILSNDISIPIVHSNDGAGFAPVTSILNPNSKLREALQKERLGMDFAVTLHDIAHTKKLPLTEESGDSVVVHQILDEYRDTMDKHPELGHVPARRKRIQDHGNGGSPPKRTRRVKKDVVVASSNRDYTFSSPNRVQVPSAATASPMNHVQVPLQPQQTPSSSRGQARQCNQMNNVYGSLSSGAALVLPSCVTTGISSQTYGDVSSCENEVTSNILTYETNDSGHLMNTNGCADKVASVPLQTSNTYWPDDSNLMNLDRADVAVRGDDGCGNLKESFCVATVCNDSIESTDSAVVISIPEIQNWDAYLRNCSPLSEDVQSLLSSDGPYSKNQNYDTTDTQNVQLTSSSAVPEQDNATFENGIIVNNMPYDPDYFTEMNNFGT